MSTDLWRPTHEVAVLLRDGREDTEHVMCIDDPSGVTKCYAAIEWVSDVAPSWVISGEPGRRIIRFCDTIATNIFRAVRFRRLDEETEDDHVE